MRSEDDLRAALRSLERLAPDLESVLPALDRRIRVRRSGRGRRWRRIGGPILVALAVTAAVLVPLYVRTALRAGNPNGPTSALPANPTARQVLNALAQAAEGQPAQEGEYWRVSAFDGSLGASGPNAHPYVIDRRQLLSTTWYPKSAKAKIVSYTSAELTSVLPTAGAAAAWRADGSPALPHIAAKEVSYPDFGSGGGIGDLWFGGTTLMVAQFQSLPTTTDGLKAAIVTALQRLPKGQWVGTPSQMIARTCLALLDHDPVTPAVRAAALRVLATLPGVEYHGQVTDSLDRQGVAISTPGLNTSWGTAVPAGVPPQMTTQPEFWIVLSSSGTLLDEEYVTAVPSVSGLRTLPASGAIPGPTTCPAGFREYDHGGPLCVPSKDKLSGDVITGPDHRNPFSLGYPILAVPAGTVLDYRAFLDAGWTNDSPSAAHSTQHIPSW